MPESEDEEVTVAQRVSRNLLASVYEQQRLACRVRANLWGRLGDEHKQMLPDHLGSIAVTKFTTPLAQYFADGQVLRENMKNRAGQAAWSSWTHRCQRKQACLDDQEAQRKPDGDDGCREARGAW